jgi:hypothetical protein
MIRITSDIFTAALPALAEANKYVPVEDPVCTPHTDNWGTVGLNVESALVIKRHADIKEWLCRKNGQKMAEDVVGTWYNSKGYPVKAVHFFPPGAISHPDSKYTLYYRYHDKLVNKYKAKVKAAKDSAGKSKSSGMGQFVSRLWEQQHQGEHFVVGFCAVCHLDGCFGEDHTENHSTPLIDCRCGNGAFCSERHKQQYITTTNHKCTPLSDEEWTKLRTQRIKVFKSRPNQVWLRALAMKRSELTPEVNYVLFTDTHTFQDPVMASSSSSSDKTAAMSNTSEVKKEEAPIAETKKEVPPAASDVEPDGKYIYVRDRKEDIIKYLRGINYTFISMINGVMLPGDRQEVIVFASHKTKDTNDTITQEMLFVIDVPKAILREEREAKEAAELAKAKADKEKAIAEAVEKARAAKKAAAAAEEKKKEVPLDIPVKYHFAPADTEEGKEHVKEVEKELDATSGFMPPGSKENPQICFGTKEKPVMPDPNFTYGILADPIAYTGAKTPLQWLRDEGFVINRKPMFTTNMRGHEVIGITFTKPSLGINKPQLVYFRPVKAICENPECKFTSAGILTCEICQHANYCSDACLKHCHRAHDPVCMELYGRIVATRRAQLNLTLRK